MKSGTPLFGSDIIFMIDLDVKYFSVVCLSIYYEKPAVKAYNKGTFLCREVKLLSVRHNL